MKILFIYLPIYCYYYYFLMQDAIKLEPITFSFSFISFYKTSYSLCFNKDPNLFSSTYSSRFFQINLVMGASSYQQHKLGLHPSSFS